MSLSNKLAKATSIEMLGRRVTGPGMTGVTSYPRVPRPMVNPGFTGGRQRPELVSMRPTVAYPGAMGDPGIFGDIGRFIGGAVKAVPVVGGLAGGAITGLSNLLDPPKQQRASVRTATPQLPPMANISPFQRAQSTRIDLTPLPGAIYESTTTNGGGPAPSGYHWNKADYFLRDGTFVRKGSKLVKNRRRNPMNPRALDRAMGRITSAKRASKKLSRITIRKPAACK